MISQEIIEQFLAGEDPEQYIVALEYDYPSNKIFKIIQHPEKGKYILNDSFTPFAWVGSIDNTKFYNGSKALQKQAKIDNGITIEKLTTEGQPRLDEGMRFIVKSTKTYQALIKFFKDGGIDPWGRENSNIISVLSPVEQYLIQKRKRLFKGIDEYTGVHRFVFDIETTGLDPKESRIFLMGIKDNRGYEEVLEAETEDEEAGLLSRFFEILKEIKATVIGGYNSAAFDLPFIVERARYHGIDVKEETKIFSQTEGLKSKDGMLKLANEVETYTQFQLWGHNIVDIAHSVRRAQAINSDIKSWGLKYITKFIDKEKPNRMYVDGDKIYTTYFENKQYYVNKSSGTYKEIGSPGTEDLLTRFPGKYEIWTGKKIVRQYLLDDLYETMVVDESFNQATFLLSKLVPTTYERASTMGTATLWKIIMMAWSYQNELAIPKKVEKREFTGGLSRLVQVGYSRNIIKFDFSSLYPSIQLVHDIFPECDITGAMKSMLKYFRGQRIFYKREAEKVKKENKALSESYDRKQLPLKIFINAFFGSLSAPLVFPWGDIDKGEEITCCGRQYLRMMIMFFMSKGYTPLVMDTDGVNFTYPDSVNDVKYIGKGLNDLVQEGKEYTGVKAQVAEFNDIFMRNEMGLDIDYSAPSCINLARKNYAIMKENGKVKLTGNTIKSKKLQTYMVEFIDEGVKLLLEGKGYEFLEFYYSYVKKIYNKEIPLAKIANKSRVKSSVKEYALHCKKKTKAGSLMSRQAHMELILKEGYLANLGETILYINNGTKKSHGDVSKKGDDITLHCYRIDEKEIQANPDKTGDYNVPRYLSNFNKRIEPLLVVFHPEIRESILIDDPEKRPYFTKTQCTLVSGFPLEEKNQDDLNKHVMEMEDSEILFWNKVDKDPYFMYPDSTLDLVDNKWVTHNRNLLTIDKQVVI